MLTLQQQKAAHQTDRPIIVTANAGSGKTRVLVERIRHLICEKGLAPYRILAFTFTEKAAGEMKERLLREKVIRPEEENLLSISTLHGFLNRFLKKNALRVDLSPDFVIVDENRMTLEMSHRLHEAMSAELSLPTSLIQPWIRDHGFARLHHQLLNLTRDSAFFMSPNPEPSNSLLCWIRPFYENFLKERIQKGKLFFDDLEILSLRLLEKSDIRQQMQKRYAHILVDEFQDTSPLQAMIIQNLFHPESNTLFAVGDPKQSIYRFRQADIRYFHHFAQLIIQSGGEEIILPHTFRLAPTLTEKINQVFEPLFSERDSSTYAAMQTGSQTHEGHLRVVKLSNAKIDAANLRQMEARFIAQDIAKNVKTENWSKTAVLFRQGTYMLQFQEALDAVGVPSHIAKTDNLLASPYINDLLLLVDYFWGQPDAITRLGLLRSPLFGFSEAFIDNFAAQNPPDYFTQFTPSLFLAEADRHAWMRFSKEIQHWQSLSQKMPALDLLTIIRADINPRLELAYDMGRRELEMEFGQWFALCRDMLADKPESISEEALLHREWKELREAQTMIRKAHVPGSNNAVQLLTIHAAKGLEFENVYLPQLYSPPRVQTPLILFDHDKRFAIRESDAKQPKGLKVQYNDPPLFEELKNKAKMEEREENKRLLYVAMTRAQKNLILFLKESSKKPLCDLSLPGDWLSSLLSTELSQAETLPANFDASPERAKHVEGSIVQSPAILTENNRQAQPPRIYSVSQLETQLRCAVEYELKYRRHILPVIAKTEGLNPIKRDHFRGQSSHGVNLPASTWGSLLHEVLQFLSSDSHSNRDTVIAQALFNQQLADTDGKIREKIEETLTILFSDKTIADLLKAETGKDCEIPFMLQLESFSLKGTIDRWVKIGDTLWVIDYKTDYVINEAEAAERSQSYWGQVAAYVLAAKQSHPHLKIASALIFSKLPLAVSHEWSDEEINHARETLVNLHRSIEKPNYPLPYAENRKTCEHCAYYSLNYCGVRNS